jgi:hypothetical protein
LAEGFGVEHEAVHVEDDGGGEWMGGGHGGEVGASNLERRTERWKAGSFWCGGGRGFRG